MATIVIFGAALLCIFFFIIGAICKGMASAFSGIVTALGYTIIISFFTIAVLVALALVYEIAVGIKNTGIGSTVGMIILIVIEWGIVFGLGRIIVGFISNIVSFLVEKVEDLLFSASVLCEKGYIYFVRVIITRIDER